MTELIAIRVTAVRRGGAPIIDNQRYILGVAAGAFRLPGEIGVIPRDPGDSRIVDVTVTAEMRDTAQSFGRQFAVRIAAERITVLDVFLALRCTDATTRMCPTGQSCGASGCEAIEVLTLPNLFTDAGETGTADVGASDADGAMDALDATDVPDAGDARTDGPPVDGCTLGLPDLCGGVCTNVRTDRLNCGVCGLACANGPNVTITNCVAAACVIAGCAAGFGNCDAVTSNGCETALTTSNTNCGACGRACGFGATCVAGACTCSAGSTLCGTRCVDLQTNTANCGACARTCSVGGLCTAGTCSCPAATPMVCAGTCVDVNTSIAHCGACGNACMPTFTCSAGTCACPATASTRCGTVCSDTMTDPANCGACGTACMATFACIAGTCACPATASTLCTGRCTNTMTDASNCGACGTACAAGQACLAGACVTPTRHVLVPAPSSVTFVDACAATGAARVLVSIDDGSVPARLPFAFRYWATDLPAASLVTVGSNGFIGMDGVASASLGGTIPSVTVPNALIAAHWTDIMTRATGVCVATVGTAPNRQFVVEWSDATYFMSVGTEHLTFEIVLTETTNTIDLIFQDMRSARSGTVGVENQTGTAGVGGCALGASTCVPATGQRARFVPSA